MILIIKIALVILALFLLNRLFNIPILVKKSKETATGAGLALISIGLLIISICNL